MSESKVTLDGDLPGHVFRGNQYVKQSRTSGTAVSATIHAKRVSRTGTEKEVRAAHRIAHHSHIAASIAAVTNRNAGTYHRKMAKLHAKQGGFAAATMDDAALDSVKDDHATAVIRNKDGADVGLVLIYQDGSAGIRDAAGNRITPVSESTESAADGVKAVLQGRAVPGSGVNNVASAKSIVFPFLSRGQRSAVNSGLNGEESEYFADTLKKLATTIKTMPETYGQDGKGGEAVAYLHYFKGSGDWYITEKDAGGGDVENKQQQAFGLADLFGDGGETGYISIEELIANGVELDFHWTPKTINQIRGKGEEVEPESGSNFGADVLDAFADAGWTPMAPASGHNMPIAETTRNGIRFQFHANISANPRYTMLDVWDGDAWVPPPSEADAKSVTITKGMTAADVLKEIEKSVASIVAVMEKPAETEVAGGDDESPIPAEENTIEPSTETPVTEPDSQDADKALFQSVIDGTVADILSPELADELEAAFLRHESDAVMAGLFEQAVNAYTAAMLTATANL